MKGLSQLSIHCAGSQQAHKIALLHAKLFDPPWSQDFLEGLLNQRTTLSFVASLENKEGIVGFLMATFIADEAEILSLGVDKDFQRYGIGSELLSAFLEKLKSNKARRVFLEVRVDNTAAEGLYKKHGFEVVGKRKNYYEGRNRAQVDAVIMSLSL